MISDEDDKKSVCSFECPYSDEIDSDVEVELYSMVHYESNLSASNLCTPLKSSIDDWISSQPNENLPTMCESNLKSIKNDELGEDCKTAVEVKKKFNVPFNSTINKNEKLKSLISAKFRKSTESNVVLPPTSKWKKAHFNNFRSPIQHEVLCQKENNKSHFEEFNSKEFQSQRNINRTRDSLNRPVIDGETAAEVMRRLTVPFINIPINDNKKSKTLIEEKLQKQYMESNSVLSSSRKKKKPHLKDFLSPTQHEESYEKQSSKKRHIEELNSTPSSSCKKKKPHLKDYLSPIQHNESLEKQRSKKRQFEELNSEKFPSQRKKNRKADSSNQPIPVHSLEINDSDSDYIIIDDDDESDSSHKKSKIVTNMNSAEKTNIFNIDSSSNDSLSSKVFNPTHGFSNGKISGKDPWHFAPRDEELQSRIKCRLFMNKEYRCHRCYKQGHPTSFCPRNDVQRKCAVCCGQRKCMFRCKQNMCHKCHQMGHGTKQCKVGDIICNRCGMEGHQSNGCPDLWRRFHLTTNLSEFTTSQKLPQSNPIYCFNCGQKGHFGPHCEQMNGNTNTWKTWPAVISYKDQCVPTSKRTKVTETGESKKKASQKNASKIWGKLKMKKNTERKIKDNFSVTLKANSGERDFPRNPKQKCLMYNPGGHKDDILLTRKKSRLLDYIKKKRARLKSRFSKKAKNVQVDADF